MMEKDAITTDGCAESVEVTKTPIKIAINIINKMKENDPIIDGQCSVSNGLREPDTHYMFGKTLSTDDREEKRAFN